MKKLKCNKGTLGGIEIAMLCVGVLPFIAGAIIGTGTPNPKYDSCSAKPGLLTHNCKHKAGK